MSLSIRWRLTLWNTVALALVLTTLASLVYGLLHRAFLNQADRLLNSSLTLLQNDPRVHGNTAERIAYWVEEFEEHQGLACVISRRDGTVREQTPNLPTLPPLPELAPEESQRTSTLNLPEGGRQRAMQANLRLGQHDYTLLLLAPLAVADQELDLLLSVFFTLGPVALLLCGGLGYWMARQALIPVERLRQATEAITADRLDQRLVPLTPHDELGRLTQTINAMIERLERSFAQMRRFTADASHELRTPLTIIRTAIEVALSQARAAEKDRDLLEMVLEEIGRMTRLTELLLALSRRDAGVDQFAAVPLDLSAVLSGVVEALRPMAEARGIALISESSAPATIAGEEGRLRQVFINLLDNAIKFTPAGGQVKVLLQVDPDRVTVRITDTGPGIPKEHLARIFERFYRVDRSRSRTDGGTGLGLSIAQSLVQAHGGSIIALSAPQGGHFEVTFPLR